MSDLDVDAKLGEVAELLTDFAPQTMQEARLFAALAAVARIVSQQEDRLRVLEPCREGNGRPHRWLDDGACGYCRTRRRP